MGTRLDHLKIVSSQLVFNRKKGLSRYRITHQGQRPIVPQQDIFSTPMVVTILLFAANRELQDPCTHLAAAFSDDVSRQAATVKVLNNKTISVRRSEDLLPMEKNRSVFQLTCIVANLITGDATVIQ
jgi:hypothetical protein